MKIENTIITNWAKEFPGLTVINNFQAVSICNPFVLVLGIFPDRKRKTYTPKLLLHNLCYGTAYLFGDMTLTDTRRFHMYYKYSDELSKYIDTIDFFKNNTPIPFSQDIYIEDLIAKLKKYCDTAYDYEKFTILRSLMHIAIWSGDDDIIRKMLVYLRNVTTLLPYSDWYKKITEGVKETQVLRYNVKNSLDILGLNGLSANHVYL